VAWDCLLEVRCMTTEYFIEGLNDYHNHSCSRIRTNVEKFGALNLLYLDCRQT
jgi:hypothetical protein